jgi:asparagine synthase (glutamine-hydrolysing)
MTSALYRRGPDAGSCWIDADAGLALGHRRLAIIELSDLGAQPMLSECGRYVITFNGEIYNHLALRNELEQSTQCRWRGTSDTETLLACVAAWGVTATLQKSVGMFAIALWDRVQRQLILARDRFGEKPLYYGWVGQGPESLFVFGSELKALRAYPGFKRSIDQGALALFLCFGYVPTPYSIYKDIFKLEPGSILVLDRAGIRRRDQTTGFYWRFEDLARAGVGDPIHDEDEATERLEHAIRHAIDAQTVADVPLGAFLSGGIDSSTVVAIMQARSRRPVKTFTVGFDEKGFDEAPHAAAVANYLGTDHQEIRVSTERTQAIIPKLSSTYDEPFADPSQIPTSIVCQIARQSVTVALSGDGGDELFGGYDRYVWGAHLQRLAESVPGFMLRATSGALCAVPVEQWNRIGEQWPLNRCFSQLGPKMHKLAAALAGARSIDTFHRSLSGEWSSTAIPLCSACAPPTKFDQVKIAPEISHPEHRMMFLDAVTYLPDDILVKMDRAAMAVSLETRVPMLDHRVAEVAWRLPLSMKIRKGRGKWILRKVLNRYLPAPVIERPKAGFTVPLGEWLRGPLRDWAEALLSEQRLLSEGYLNAAIVRDIWQEHISEKRDWSSKLWHILMFQAWLEDERAVSIPSAPAPFREYGRFELDVGTVDCH